MQNISYSAKFMNSHPDMRDVLSLFSYLAPNGFLDNYACLYLSGHKAEPCASNKSMTTISIYFSVWKDGEIGGGDTFVWNNYRAIDFSCGNISVSRVDNKAVTKI